MKLLTDASRVQVQGRHIPSLSKDFGESESQKINDWDDISPLVGEMLLAALGWHKRPELVEVDNWLPEVVLLLVEVPHTDLTEVTRMVFVQIGPVVMLSTSHLRSLLKSELNCLRVPMRGAYTTTTGI